MGRVSHPSGRSLPITLDADVDGRHVEQLRRRIERAHR
jgi:hypothetical protein